MIFLLNDLACFSFRSAAAAEPVQQSLQKNLNPHRGSGQADIDEGQIESGNKKWRVFLCAARAVVLSRACNEVGHGRSPCAFSRRFCAVKSGAAGGGSFHDLRHTFATHALTSGVDVKTLSGILGHTRATFTLDTYTHTTGDMQKRAAEIVDEFLTDIFGEELKPWQENEKTEKELSA